jgi:hypothetical protein
MVKITLFKPDGTSQEYLTEAQQWGLNNGVLAFKPAGPGNMRIRTTLPFVVEFEDKT